MALCSWGCCLPETMAAPEHPQDHPEGPGKRHWRSARRNAGGQWGALVPPGSSSGAPSLGVPGPYPGLRSEKGERCVLFKGVYN